MMLAMDASWWWACAAFGLAAGVVARLYWRSRSADRQIEQLNVASQQAAVQLEELNALLQEARRRLERLEAPPSSSPARRVPFLAELEALGELRQLDDVNALGKSAEQLDRHGQARWIDPFAGEEQRRALARLADQGLSAGEIARRLERPLGEVELMLSLR
jgi:hypothetical protein